MPTARPSGRLPNPGHGCICGKYLRDTWLEAAGMKGVSSLGAGCKVMSRSALAALLVEAVAHFASTP